MTKGSLYIAGVDKLATADAADNDSLIDVIGNKTDAASDTAATASLVALSRKTLANQSTIMGALGTSGTTTGTATGGSATTIIDTVNLTQANDYFNGMMLVMTGGNNIGLSSNIVDFDNATNTATVEPSFPNVIAAGDTFTILPRSEFADILIGANNNNNGAVTSLVVANEDGSALERLEQLQEAINKGTGSSLPANTSVYDMFGAYSGDGGANQDDSIKASLDLAHTDLDAILLDTGTTLPAVLGTPAGADMSTDIAAVKTVVDGIETDIGDPSLHTLTSITAKLGDLPSDLATIFGVISDLGSGADVANNFADIAGGTFSSATDSLEAIRDQLDTLVGAPAVDLATDIAAISTLIGVPAADVATDIAAVKTVVDNIYNAVDTEVASIKASTDQIGTIVNSGGTAELGALLGDFANTTLVARLNTIDDFLDTEIAAIKAVTDVLPDAGALTSIAQESTLGTPAGADLATDIASAQTVIDETNGYLENGGAIYDALITDAAGANIAADIIVIDGIVDTLNTNLGNPAGDTLTSITAKLGDLPSDLATLIGTLQDLGGGADIANNFNDINTAIATVDGNVDTLVSTNGSNDSSGTHSYLDAGGEQDVVELTNSTRKIINSLWVDCTNLTNNGTFKIYYKVDGTNYREMTDLAYTITGGTTEAVNLLSNAGNLGITEDIKITYEEAADEGAARDIPYSIVYETKE
jgi:hypothetical protein